MIIKKWRTLEENILPVFPEVDIPANSFQGQTEKLHVP